MNKLYITLIIGGVSTFCGYVVHKLNDIHEEIEYLERRQGELTRRERRSMYLYDKQQNKKKLKENKKKHKENKKFLEAMKKLADKGSK